MYSMNGGIIPCLTCVRYKGGSAAGRGRYGRFHCIIMVHMCVEGGVMVCLCVGGAVCVCICV